MRFENPDEYWTVNSAVAGPLAQLIASLSDDEIRAIRATLDPSLAPFERYGGLEFPWLCIGTSAA
jgi:hypothetical protein